ncbi:o-succinylbenzoate synthase [Halostella sp. JP-L12]|uniref:o-succinylbenzoate synthase n=1 Tax=Halostella TaxID=1843185 RepID=UPI000EF807C3|nr:MULTISPECIES: o-succinylbenzoate synthase [Halostella]NHN49664.1 o-succinylbenzoate synthase [Halostella sp. JP-L12]
MRLERREFAVPLSRPLGTARGEITAREGILVRIRDGGRHGVGEAAPLPGWTESLAACREALSRAARALPQGPDAALDAVGRDRPAARHAVSLALADLRAARAGVPLYRYLGGEAAVTTVPVNATVGDAPPAETARRASDAVADGFDCVKVKVGARPVDADLRRLRSVRDAVGPGVELRADANGAWTPAQAERAFDAFADLGVAFVEQPLPADDLDGHAALRRGPVGVAVDEGVGAHGVDAVLDAGAADVLVLKPMALGGVDRARDAALRARRAGVTPVVTTTVDAVVARTAAVHLAASLPGLPACGLATAERLAEDLTADPAPVRDGAIHVPQLPGNGTTGAWER